MSRPADNPGQSTADNPVAARLPPAIATPITRGVVAAAVVFGLFVVAMGLSRGLVRVFASVVTIGELGSLSRLFVNTTALQVLGFGVPAAAFLLAHNERWRSYLRLRECTTWTVFYGSAVGLALMLVAVGTTLVFSLLGIAPAESAAGQARDPLFYLVLFAVSSAVAVPMEELFFRGLLQRRLADGIHPTVAVAVASVLFASIHSNVSVGSGGEIIAFGMFVSLGVVLGVAYYWTENLFVPIIGHAIFNGVQILIRGLEVAL